MNKLNKLVASHFDDEVYKIWMSEDFQKKVKKIVKKKNVTKKSTEDEENSTKKPKEYTPYISFCMKERDDLKSKYPDMKATQITAKLGELWNEYKEKDPEYLFKYNYIPK